LAVKLGELVPASDGHMARLVGVWSKEKLHYVQRYCSIFNIGMQYKWEYRVYIDLFSGPGRCAISGTREEIDGSPVIAYRSVPPFTHLLFNDLDPLAIDALRGRVEALGAQGVQYFIEDCNVAARRIGRFLDAIPSRSLLSLCFIDPTGWQIAFSSVEELTRGRRMDLIVVFQIGYMKRFADQEPGRLTAFFGDDAPDPDWRRLYLRARGGGGGASRALLDHYQERLRGIGYVSFHDEVLVEKDNNGVPLYHMLFASKNKRGLDFWHKISRRQHHGQLRLALD
jgi:three-Cys-motif partner protein